jgi:MYXO-CTERM domain-containing protein
VRAGIVIVLVLLFAAPAQAFQILTPASKPCHERITLGAIHAIDSPWSSDDDTDLEAQMAALMAKAQAHGVPGDKRTQAFVQDVVRLYKIRASTPAQRWVFASFVAGVRQPDTRGLSVVRVNNARETHLDDDGQAAHSLRRSFDDYDEGNRAALLNIREGLNTRFDAARTSWKEGQNTRRATWTLPHYGEFNVTVFAPAFDLGHMVHTLQDSYAHVLRDDDFRVLSIGNFVDTQSGAVKESRDGLGHSERMDFCEFSDEFDAMRVREARESSARWVLVAMAAFESDDAAPMDPLLDEIYDFREGCTVENDFCGTSWLGPARMDVTEPIQLWFCSTTPADAGAPGAPALFAAALLVLLVLRRR